jgi:hypothetical protein
MFKKRQHPGLNDGSRQAMDTNDKFNPAGMPYSGQGKKVGGKNSKYASGREGQDDIAQDVSHRKRGHDSEDELD